jgi:hypothetical protein
MFLNAAGSSCPYEDPWHSSYEDRLKELTARQKKVAYLYESPDAHTFRYRVFNMVEALEAQPELGVSASWFTRSDLEVHDSFVDKVDVLIISRVRYDALVGRLISRARARGLRVLFDIDDLIFDIRYAHFIGQSIKRKLERTEEWDWWFGYIARLGATLQLCDGAITTNAFLADRIKEFMPHFEVRVIPNFYNRRQEVISNQVFQRKCASGFARDGRFHIGYFSGTNTHDNDFRVASGALGRLLAKNPNFVLRIVGTVELTGEMKEHQDQIERFPLQDFVNLQRLQGEMEVCIAPLQSNIFTNSKSELKYFEPALTGSVTVASKTFAFHHAIQEPDDGFLSYAHEWEEKIDEARRLVNGDPDAYRAFANKMIDTVKRRYGWNKQGAIIVDALFN